MPHSGEASRRSRADYRGSRKAISLRSRRPLYRGELPHEGLERRHLSHVPQRAVILSSRSTSAEVFETQGKYSEAIEEYRKAIAKNPKAINLHYRLARALLQQSHDPAVLDQARREFEAELSLNPSDAVAEYQVGQLLIAQQKASEAAAHLERAAQLRPDFPEALIAVAKLRSDAKRYPDAIALLERAINLQPRNETAHYNLMIAYRNAGRAADALREKTELEKLQKPPEGEFTDFLKRLGEKK